MEAIRPSSDLRNHYNEISKQCHEERGPVFITANGYGEHCHIGITGLLLNEIRIGTVVYIVRSGSQEFGRRSYIRKRSTIFNPSETKDTATEDNGF